MESIQKFFVNFWEKFKAWIDANPLRAGLWAAAIVLFIGGFFLPVDPPHVALSGEPIFSAGPRWLTNSLITTLIVDVILIACLRLCNGAYESCTLRLAKFHGDSCRRSLWSSGECCRGSCTSILSLGRNRFPLCADFQLDWVDPRCR